MNRISKISRRSSVVKHSFFILVLIVAFGCMGSISASASQNQSSPSHEVDQVFHNVIDNVARAREMLTELTEALRKGREEAAKAADRYSDLKKQIKDLIGLLADDQALMKEMDANIRTMQGFADEAGQFIQSAPASDKDYWKFDLTFWNNMISKANDWKKTVQRSSREMESIQDRLDGSKNMLIALLRRPSTEQVSEMLDRFATQLDSIVSDLNRLETIIKDEGRALEPGMPN